MYVTVAMFVDKNISVVFFDLFLFFLERICIVLSINMTAMSGGFRPRLLDHLTITLNQPRGCQVKII